MVITIALESIVLRRSPRKRQEYLRRDTMDAEGAELVQLCLKGDDAAWARLVKEYKGLIYSICHLSCISEQDADDLAQEAFIRIWMSLPSYNPDRGGLRS